MPLFQSPANASLFSERIVKVAALTQIGVACIFHLIDMATGIIGAIREKAINSAKMRDGLFKKLGFIFCYILAYLIDTQGETIGLHFDAHILPIVIIYAVTTEVVSIIENISKINPDLLPEKLQDIFKVGDYPDRKEGKNA